MRATKRRITVAAAVIALGALATSAAGCRVAENDVKRWESTQRGPYKLVAVVTHDKYAWDLRTDAALSLIRMPPRGGVRQGIGFLIDKYKDEEGESRDGANRVAFFDGLFVRFSIDSDNRTVRIHVVRRFGS